MEQKEYEEKRNDLEARFNELSKEWQALEAEHFDEEAGFLSGWVLIGEVVAAGQDGEASGITWFNSKGLSWARKLGMLRATTLKMESDYVNPEEDEED